MTTLLTWLESSYMLRAILELGILSLLSGIMGTLIVLRKRSFYAVALSHATFPGGVIAAVLGLSVMLGQAIAAVVLSLLLAYLNQHRQLQQTAGEGAATGIVLAFGFALGALLSSLRLGNNVPVDALLIGSLFGVQNSDLLSAGAVLFASLLLLVFMGRQLLFETFDSYAFSASGGKAGQIEILATALIAATIVVAMPAIGAILAVALVIGPAATAMQIAPNLKWVPPLATGFALLASGMGLWTSIQLSIAAGGAVGLSVAILFLITYLAKYFYGLGHLSKKKAA